MRPADAVRLLRVILPVSGSIPLAWSLSHTWVGGLAGEVSLRVFDSYFPLVSLLIIILPISMVASLVLENGFTLAAFQFALFLLPTLWGVRLSALKGYTLGGIVFSLLLLAMYYIEWLALGGETVRIPPSIILATLDELKVPVLVGLLFTVLPLYWSGLGESPSNAIPFSLLLPLAFIGAFAIAAGYSSHSSGTEGNVASTVIVLRTFMTAGDSFEIKDMKSEEGLVTLALTGGSPSKRPILMTLKQNGEPPRVIILRSPWESKMLFKKYEWMEGRTRYLVYSDSRFRAPSSPDNASAPRSAPQSLFPSKIA
ncbi:hypothetical protein E3E36_02220 [Thermococcus sp. M36]|uniref:hypothetical protein n=1 Tax=Thermococcus sp. M36 TaxID=1638261 RepID=UPI001438DC07|nr:hypothetical protein [Thermococcus sp. M36]NJE04982.1 hypothetical protein [Thermococcus sp. M36]